VTNERFSTYSPLGFSSKKRYPYVFAVCWLFFLKVAKGTPHSNIQINNKFLKFTSSVL